jgi:hypothetical protein
MKNFLTGLMALLLAGSAHAQAADAICRVQAPRVPQLEWRGQAAYQAMATVSGGRVVAINIRPLHGDVDRRAQRALIQAIDAALRAAPCQPGEHVFEQRFDFTLGDARTSAPVERRAPPADADADATLEVETAAPAAHACRVDPPQLPPAVAASGWRGQAAYLSRADIRDGRVLRLSTRVLRPGVDAQVQRDLMAAVRASLNAAQCPPGEHVVEQRFDFDLRANTAATP